MLDRTDELDAFLRGVERRALVMARGMMSDREEALDVVQDSMIRFVRKYRDRPTEEWRPLFFRIVVNRVRDWQRRQVVRARVMSWLRPGQRDPMEIAAAAPGTGPESGAMGAQAISDLEDGIRALSSRQQQAFVLRCLEGLDVEATAAAMGCSSGSVKTHYSRALASLRRRLGEHRND